MNRLLVLLLLVAPLLLQAQRKPKLRGNRKVLEVSERLPAFRAIELKDDLTVNLSRANEESYDMAADENLLDVVNFDVIDGTLVISSFYQITARKKLEIVVYYRDLVSLTAEDGELLAHEMLTADEIDVLLKGDAKLKLGAEGKKATVHLQNRAQADLNLEVTELEIDARHRSDLPLFAVADKTEVELNDTASIDAEGTSAQLHAEIAGNARLRAQRLETTEVELTLDGSGLARVLALARLTLDAGGNGKAFLSGDPTIVIKRFEGEVQLQKKKREDRP